MDETLWKPELLFICIDFSVIVDILMILSAAGFVVFSAKYFWWSNVRSVFLAMSVQALTLKSESGILRSWCVCWSAAQTLSPGGHEGRFKMQLDKFHPKDRLHMFDDCLLTWTATPKLFPSSILGIWSCTHIDTFQENKRKKNPTSTIYKTFYHINIFCT